MWFGKNIMTKLGLVLAMAVPALAADVAPLEFKGASGDEHQTYWNKLMSFKMWGTDSIYLGRAQMPSLSGAIGTAKNFTLKDDRHFLGGPIYVGGDFTGGNGTDTIVSGPVRVNGSFNVGVNDNVLHGTYCVGAANSDAVQDINATPERHYGETHEAYFGKKGYDAPKGTLNEGCNAVTEVPTYLTIPDVKDVPSDAAIIPVNGDGDVSVNETYVIDVPPIEGDKKMYDYYINGSFNIGSSGKLIIRMQSSKSLARFFLNGSFKIASSSIVQVVYVDKDAKYEYATTSHKAVDGSYGKWTNVTEEDPVDNKDYAGNLMFHCKESLNWPSMNGGAYVQGSFLSLKDINLGSNLVLAGQLLATRIIVQNEFDGKSFRYVPFDPPILEPTADGGNIVYEGHASDKIVIELDKDHNNHITFDYCFEFEGTKDTETDLAVKADISDDLPIYDPATKTCSKTPGSSGFLANETKLEKDIVIHVEDDELLEKEYEEFKIWILNLDGAVLPTGEHDGPITIKIKDNDAKPLGADYAVVGTEDVPYYFDAFTVTNSKGKAITEYSVKIESLPSAGSLVLVNAAGQDSVVLKKGDFVPSTVINSDSKVGKFVLRFDDDDYTEGPAPDPAKAIDRYNFEFRVVDKGNASEAAYTASVIVAPVNDAPVAKDTEFSIPENSVTTKADTTFATSEAKDGAFDATDVDDPVLTYKFDDTFDTENTEENYLTVTALYGIDPATGKIFVKEGAVLDYESADSVHTIRVVITDKSASTGDPADILSTKITATIKIADIEEKPEFPNKYPKLAVDENSVKDTEVGAVTAEDDDCKDKNCSALTYVVVADTNAAHKDDVNEFKIDSKTGMITLVNDSTLNYEDKDTYYVLVIAYDGDPKDAKTLSDTARVEIDVQDVNDKPEIKNQEFKVVENAKVGTRVDSVKASDEDKWSVLSYKIEDLPNATEKVAKLFSISSKGVITVSADGDGVLDYEKKDTYEIVVIVTDNGEAYGKTISREFKDLSDTAIITIKITDEPEKPVFPNKYPKLAVDENSVKDTEVGTVTAEDDDCKDNDCSALTYVVVADTNAAHKDDINEFKIDSKTGMVTLVNDSTLNYEDKDTYYVLVIAYDGDPKDAETLSDTARVEIDVQDVNDKPEIKNQEFKVVENAKVGTRVDSVKASDEDKWSVLSYKIEDLPNATENVAKLFSISSKGVITVSADGDGVLDYETKDTYEIVVIVTDNGEEYGKTIGREFEDLSDTAIITIKITDEDEKPGFDDDYEFAVDENSLKGTNVGAVSASDDDCKDQNCNDFIYSLIADESAANAGDVNEFVIDPASGKITLAKDSTLNYEKKDTYHLRVVAYDGDPKDAKTLSDTALVTVKVQDVNDKPEIKNQEFKVVENAKVGTRVDSVKASDEDKWSVLSYKIEDLPNATENVAKLFSISSKGVITVSQAGDGVLDYEVKDTYEIVVIVTDNGKDYGKTIGREFKDLSDTAVITIKITDEDEKPEFPNKYPVLSVNENSPRDTEVGAVSAEDDDCKDQNCTALTYVVVADTNAAHTGDVDEFKIDSKTGMITLVNDSTLDYEKKDTYYVLVIAYDGNPKDSKTLSDTARVKIEVQDVNDKPELANHEFEVEENAKVGQVVDKVIVSDQDTWAKHTFKLVDIPGETPVADIFSIDADGVIKVAKENSLNYEVKDTYVFYVIATDNGPEKGFEALSDTAKITLKIKDVPEPPHIIPECEGDKCVEICKGDKCEICVGESCHETCIDNCDDPYGEDPTKVLTVTVDENSPTDYQVISYLVSDEDLKIGHTEGLDASLKNTNSSGADSLFDAKMEKDASGIWRVVVYVVDKTKLDFEKVNETHNVTIYVRDKEDPADMGDSLLRVIKVVDVNEAPSVNDTTFTPNENLPNGTPIGTLVARDPDSKNVNFSTLTFKIEESGVPFDIDNKGVITVKDSAQLNYEKNPEFTFHVTVSDGQLSDNAKVTVKLKDVPEKPYIIPDCDGVNCPDNCEGEECGDGKDDAKDTCLVNCTEVNEHKDVPTTIGVKEMTAKDHVVLAYKVADEDVGDVEKIKMEINVLDESTIDNGTKFTDLFEYFYDKTKHQVVVKVKDSDKLDYEALRAKSGSAPDPEYKISIVVNDNRGTETQKDSVIRVIRILDVNEAPSFEVEPCVIAEGNEIGDSLGHVERPSDPDQFSKNPEFYTNYFKLTGGDTELFDLKRDPNDPMKIVLVAKVKFDCESGKYVCDKDGAYSVELAYGDTTLNTVYSDLKVPVTIRDINEKPTVLTDTVKVKENAPKGTVVDTVKWKDVDKFDSEMQFKIAEDPTDCFDIGSKSGIITVKKDKCSALDYEKTTIIPIQVAVTDSLGKGITVTKPITVKVLDVNEAPSIVKETFVVDEDAKKGSVVDTVKATDPDKDPKYNKLIYKVIGGDTATFKIDSITGIVTLKDTLDYETKNKYEIVVRVFDGEFADTATVPIYVNNKDEKTEVKITLYDDSTKVWHDPDTVYTNSPGRELCWVQGRSDRDLKDTCMNVHIKKDTVIVIRYKDPTTDSYGVDSLVIFFSNAAPVVTIEGDQDANLANNFYTIIENTDKADTNLYVNERKKDVRVTVKDPASKTDTSFVVNLKLETVNVPQKTLDKVNTIVKENSFILNENPKGGVTRTPVNGNEVKVSYKEVLGKDTVTVSYMTDANGDPVMVPVVNDKGKIDSIEVMTVSYNTVIDGKTVTVSFVVNSVTGEVLVKDSNGTLMESGASKVASSSSSKGNTSSSSSSSSGSTSYVTEGMFQITYSQKDALGNSTTVTYSVNEKGKLVQNSDGDSGYAVSYTYTNKYGNAATQSLYIVLDQKGPTVEILKPVKGQVIRSNYVEVVWTVNGVTQDTLTVQGLDKGPNYIKRFYRDKAGNEAADTVLVIMKDSKDVDIAVVKPVTEMNPEEVKEYYEENPPEEGETFAVSILNPTSGKEVETLKGGTFDTKKGSGEELYPGKDKKHLGPTLALDVKLPTIKDGEGNTGLGGLATLDDLILPNGKISNIGIGIDTSKLSDELKREYKEYTVEEYVEKFCEDGTKVPSDFSKFNMYNTKMQVKIWVYTSLGSFVDYFSFSQDMNDPDYTNDAGKLKMFFEMKPDRDGFVKADNGKMMGTGAYLYKVEATIRSTLRCTILDEAVLHDKPNAKRKGDKIKSSDDLLKPFGYKRPKTK